MQNDRYISFSRDIFDTRFFRNEKPKTKFEAYLDIINHARLAPGEEKNNGHVFVLARGQLVTTLHTLAKRWNWEHSKVSRFFERLEREKKVIRKSINCGTVITVLDFD